MKTDVAYYTEFTDSEGKKHYAVHKYNRLNGFVLSMRDFKFTGLQYTNKGKKENMDISNPNRRIETKPEFDPNYRVPVASKYYCVYDKSKRLIAKFREKEDADEYKIKGMGEYTVVEETTK